MGRHSVNLLIASHVDITARNGRFAGCELFYKAIYLWMSSSGEPLRYRRTGALSMDKQLPPLAQLNSLGELLSLLTVIASQQVFSAHGTSASRGFGMDAFCCVVGKLRGGM